MVNQSISMFHQFHLSTNTLSCTFYCIILLLACIFDFLEWQQKTKVSARDVGRNSICVACPTTKKKAFLEQEGDNKI